MDDINNIIDGIVRRELEIILHGYGMIVLKYEETLITYEESEDYELAAQALQQFNAETDLVVEKVWELFDSFELNKGMTREQIKEELSEVNNEIRNQLRNE